jgi:HEAT repeat protein
MRPWATKYIAVLFMGMIVLMGMPAFATEGSDAASQTEPAPSDRVTVLTESLTDDDPAIRRAAARGLGETRDVRAVGPLMALCADDPDTTVRLAALGSLAMIDDNAALPAYEDALKDEDELIRQGAAEALSGNWRESAHKALVEALKTDPSEKVRRSVAEALGNPGVLGRYKAHGWEASELTESALVMVLGSDKDYGVRAISAKMLGRFKSNRSFNALMKAFKEDKSSSVKAAAAESLGDLGMDKAVEPLIDTAMFSSDENVLAAAIKALKYFDDPGIPDAAAEGLRSSSPKVRWQAIDVLEYQGADEYADELAAIMNDDYEPEGIRAKAMEALQSMGLE